MNDLLIITAAPLERSALVLAAERAGLSVRDGAHEPWASWSVEVGGASAVILESGIGKANAAGAAAWWLAARPTSERSLAVVSTGVAGSLHRKAAIGDAVLATRSAFADEGLADSCGFSTVRAMGFPLSPRSEDDAVPSDPQAAALFEGSASTRGVIATVSTCSGTDAAAAGVVGRTGAIAEGMEGAAVGLVSRRFGVPFVEVRTISNTTGERARQHWDLPRGLDRLSEVWTMVFGRVRAG